MKIKKELPIFLLVFVCLFPLLVSAATSTPLLRFADIHQDQVVFVYGGDIYIASTHGGEAKRLTSNEGFETFPKFSRDGTKIAFSAEYSGSRQVYVMNTDGSHLKQLTWYNDVGAMPPRGGYDYRIYDWSADDQNILVRANRLPWGERMGQPYWVPVNGGMEQPLAIPEAGGGMLSPDGTKMVYTIKDREFRTWKRYRGGRAQDVWIYDLVNNTSKQLTQHDATDHQPVWVGEDIYFISDRDYHLNLYRYVEGSEPVKVTNHDQYDSLWASAGPEAIVYENGGYLWRYDPKNNQSKKLNITITANEEPLLATRKNVKDYIESMSLSPDAEQVMIAARGELFKASAKHNEIRQVSRTPAAREIAVIWSPDGKNVAYLSDATGEYELYTQHVKSGHVTQVTKDGNTWRYPPIWSPDSKKIAFGDTNQKLWVVDLADKRTQQIDRSSSNDINDYQWSPDSNWLVYTKTENTGYNSVFVHNLNKKKTHRLTSAAFNDFSPVFDPNGHYLFFLSNRDYNLSFSSYEFNYLYHQATRIYAAQLNNDAPALFPFDKPKAENKNDEGKGFQVKIDVAGFDNRVIALPGKSSNYANLQSNGESVFVVENGTDGAMLKVIDLNSDEQPKMVIDGVANYQLAYDGKNILVQKGGEYAIIKAAADQKISDKLDLTHLTMKVNPQEEWQQMFTDAWRILRDWFYDPGMHGMNWQAIHDKYLPLAQAAKHRTDLDYVFGEIAGEMNAGHIYVNSGDQPSVKRMDNGLLGAEFSKHNSGYFEITKIFIGENWTPDRRSPLTEPGVDAKVGDYVISIDGINTNEVNNIYQLLEHTADRTIRLQLNSIPTAKGARNVFVKPIKSESQLRYLDWVNSRRALVDKLSGGRIGYVHLPNTATDGNRELFKQMILQIGKDALIIDDRYNGGGFIPDRMIELLSRTTMNYWKRRGLDLDSNATPLIAHDGPKVMLTNGLSSSGGDALPYYFRKARLGKIIGTRTWGGLIGISGNPNLADGGSILASTFRFLDTDGDWAVENEGVPPDIVVIDRPELVAQGRDPSIERAVEELLKDLKENPRKSIKSPPAPTEF
ncbi:MAG: PD40 domain-containing protein [Xanthomonadales bacterium]|nr:PD40 domain-containing protein [Xanthomonadales bacterium]